MPEHATTSLGTAEDIRIDSDERGFELCFDTDLGSYMVNVQAVSVQLAEIGQRLVDYWAAGMAAARAHVLEPDGEGYDADDPKHPTYHEPCWP